VRPANSWDLRSCRQQPGESLRDYIRRFSKQRTELPNVTESDVIGAFLAGTTCRNLVSKLGRKTPTRTSELMDIATKFASSQEAVEAIFQKDKQPQGCQPEDVPEASAQRGARKKGKKKSQAKCDTADTDLIAAAEYKNPRKHPGGANLFDKMLKEPCPYHQGPVKHTLEECVMLRRHFHKAGRGDPQADGRRVHQRDIPSRMACQPCACEKERREMVDVCRLHWSKQSMSEGSLPSASHRSNRGFHCWVRNPVFP
jgi:hypothetical protein